MKRSHFNEDRCIASAENISNGWSQVDSVFWKYYPPPQPFYAEYVGEKSAQVQNSKTNANLVGELQPELNSKIAFFDLDGTIITTKSGKKYPMDHNDWKFLYGQETRNKLEKLYQMNYEIVIISNQMGVSCGKTTVKSLCCKLDAVQSSLNLPLAVLICTEDDLFRKPRTGAAHLYSNYIRPQFVMKRLSQSYGFTLPLSRKENDIATNTSDILELNDAGISKTKLQEVSNNACKIDFNCNQYYRIFFVGDAAGRVGDHSSVDLHFSKNLNVHFSTPEEFFQVTCAKNHRHSKRERDGNAKNAEKKSDFDAFMQLAKLSLTEINARKEQCFHKIRKYTLDGPTRHRNIDVSTTNLQAEDKRIETRQDVVLLVGAPGSGKTSLAEDIFFDYALISQDLLKSKNVCVKRFEDALSKGQSVVVDAQNRDKNSRHVYLELASVYRKKEKTKRQFQIRCIVLETSKYMCLHFNMFRKLAAEIEERSNGKNTRSTKFEQKDSFSTSIDREMYRRLRFRKHKVPEMIINSYFKNFQIPEKSEGFDEIIFIDPLKDLAITNDTLSPGNECMKKLLFSHLQ